MTDHCYQQLAQALQSGSAVLATVVGSRGSVPREVGAKMVICSDGQFFNTIGGGAGEAKVIRQAIAVLATGERQFVEIDLTGATGRETQGVCGGMMQVWLERWSGEAAINLVQDILNRLESGQSVTVVTPLSGDRHPYICEDITSLEPDSAFIETLQPSPILLIVGAGHVGEQLAKVAHLIGFQVMIQDDRTDWANSGRYPQATHIFNEPIAITLEQLAMYEQMYVALVTRGYKFDLEALEELLNREISCRYIGMIGSQKRVIQVYRTILEKTGISKDKLSSIYAPIGLDIGALTPEEIAVSISAELILVRRGGTGKPLCEALRQKLG